MRYSTAIFDLDGTILETLDDLWASVNYALSLHDLPICKRADARAAMGNGMEYLVSHLVPEGTPAALTAQILAEFKAHYARHCNDRTAPYPGIIDMLKELQARGIRRAVVSNKGDFAVQELVQIHFKGLLDYAVGEQAGVRRKPAPDVVDAVMSNFGVSPCECIYVGDTEVDIATAKNAGIACVIVSWGFRDVPFLREQGATCIVSTSAELFETICMGERDC